MTFIAQSGIFYGCPYTLALNRKIVFCNSKIAFFLSNLINLGKKVFYLYFNLTIMIKCNEF